VHPLLSDFRKLGIYLLAWTPIAGLLVSLLRSTGDFTWTQAAELIVPLAIVYAFMCLSGWYLCKFVPAGVPAIWYLLIAMTPAAAVASLMWAGGFAWAVAAEWGLERNYLPHRPMLFGAGMLIYLLAIAVHYALLTVESSRQSKAREMEAQVLARDAELRALKAQIDPHFLFNSLNSISALTSSDPAKAREMCVLLSDFLRTSLGMGDRDHIPLGEELALARKFLAIQAVRFGDRLQTHEDIEAGLAPCPVPPLILQPLVENAVTHGISTMLQGGLVSLRAHGSAAQLTLTVENTFDPEAPKRRRGGLGLANVRKRLYTRYGSAARLDVLVEGNRFRVELLLPRDNEVRA
jgi:two-component system sensor histidine kinase AlgZ